MWDVRKYFDENNVEYRVSGANYFTRCLWHEERSGSLAITLDGKALYCFGCGEKGNLLKYVQKATPYVNIIEYIDSPKNKRYTIQNPTAIVDRRKELHDLFTTQLGLYESDREIVRQYLTGLLSSPKVAQPIYFSNYSWALFFPVYQYDSEFKEDILVGIQRRHLFTRDFDQLGYPYPLDKEALDCRPKWQISKHFSKNQHLYGFVQAALQNTYEGIVLVEGIRDKIVGEILYPNFLWLATFGCHLSKKQIQKLLTIHRNRPVVIGYDTDSAGLEGSKDVAKALAGRVLLKRGVVHGAKDVGELTEITERTFFEIDSNIAPLFSL